MRIWSLHPQYLDTKGLVALWRESLLARCVLEGKTRGYKNHPQLIRFKASADPVECINLYLTFVYEEGHNRGYNFDRNKIRDNIRPVSIPVTTGQAEYEKLHLLQKLKKRDVSKYDYLIKQEHLILHPLFELTEGKIEKWELIK